MSFDMTRYDLAFCKKSIAREGIKAQDRSQAWTTAQSARLHRQPFQSRTPLGNLAPRREAATDRGGWCAAGTNWAQCDRERFWRPQQRVRL